MIIVQCSSFVLFSFFCFLVTGYDHQAGGGQVWTVPVGGMCVRQPVSIGGSGSTFLYGMMDYMYKEKMSQADCEKLVTQMVTQAIRRDGSSGGCCRLATITKVKLDRMVDRVKPWFMVNGLAHGL